jgi:hypothetical protein
MSILVHDAENLFPKCPFGGERLRNDPHVTARRHQQIVFAVAGHSWEPLDAFVFEGRIAKEAVLPSYSCLHHNWATQGRSFARSGNSSIGELENHVKHRNHRERERTAPGIDYIQYRRRQEFIA